MAHPLVGIVVGSRAEFSVMKKGLEALRAMGVPYKIHFASPHRTPTSMRRFAEEAHGAGLEVLICAASGSSIAPAILASHTVVPVIAIPVDSAPLGGEDALVGVAQPPPGFPIATVGINSAENAAILAAQILCAKHSQFHTVLVHHRTNSLRRLEASYNDLVEEYPELCDPQRTSPTGPIMSLMDDDTDPGSEDATPEPAPATTGRIAPIRPGAKSPALPRPPRPSAGWLVATPEPQEPGTATEDPELAAEMSLPFPSSILGEEAALPPPDNDDLLPGSGAFLKPPMPSILLPERENPGISVAPPPVPLTSEEFADPANTRDTKVFEIDHDDPSEDVLDHAMMILLEGGIVALPTDTVYGLAVDATNTEAIANLYQAKGHSAQQKSVSILIPDPGMLDTLVREVPPAIESLLEEYWPGGLTVIFYRHPAILEGVSDQSSVAIRIPKDNIPLALMRMIKRPLAVINAALANAPAAVNAHEVIDRFHGRIDCILDAGPCRSAQTSTVLSVLSEPYEILREGAIPRRDLKKKLQGLLKD